MKKLSIILILFINLNCFSQDNKFTFIDKFQERNIIDAELNVLDIDQIYKFEASKGEVRIIVTGSGGATDFGPYKTTYLIFDNGFEMPWRYAVYDIGNLGIVSSVKQKSDSIYFISCYTIN